MAGEHTTHAEPEFCVVSSQHCEEDDSSANDGLATNNGLASNDSHGVWHV